MMRGIKSNLNTPSVLNVAKCDTDKSPRLLIYGRGSIVKLNPMVHHLFHD